MICQVKFPPSAISQKSSLLILTVAVSKNFNTGYYTSPHEPLNLKLWVSFFKSIAEVILHERSFVEENVK